MDIKTHQLNFLKSYWDFFKKPGRTAEDFARNATELFVKTGQINPDILTIFNTYIETEDQIKKYEDEIRELNSKISEIREKKNLLAEANKKFLKGVTTDTNSRNSYSDYDPCGRSILTRGC